MANGIDADLRRTIAEIEALGLTGLRSLTVPEARERFRTLVDWLHAGTGTDAPAELLVVDEQLPGRAGPIATRVYDPGGDRSVLSDVVVFFHGGGWMVGDLDTHDATARAIAVHLGSRVVAVDYRLAPEHPFPAALHDCLDVIDAIERDPATAAISLAGDSAGGNLAAAAAIACRDAGGTAIAAQLLIYPVLEPGRQGGSINRFADGYLLTREDLAVYADRYVPTPSQRLDPLAAPVRARSLARLPPAVVATAGFDPLLDEGRHYASSLVDAEVSTIYLPFPSLTHGWMDMTARVPAAARARTLVLDAFAALVRAPRTERAAVEVRS